MLGEYPAVTLAMARKRARKAQSEIDDGRDIAGERQEAKVMRTDTVATLADDYLTSTPGSSSGAPPKTSGFWTSKFYRGGETDPSVT